MDDVDLFAVGFEYERVPTWRRGVKDGREEREEQGQRLFSASSGKEGREKRNAPREQPCTAHACVQSQVSSTPISLSSLHLPRAYSSIRRDLNPPQIESKESRVKSKTHEASLKSPAPLYKLEFAGSSVATLKSSRRERSHEARCGAAEAIPKETGRGALVA